MGFDIYDWRKNYLRNQLLLEAEKKEEDKKEEDIDTEITDDTEIDTEESSDQSFDDEFSDDTTSGNDEDIKIQTALKNLFDSSKQINDPKLTTLISNTITYFTKNHITKK